QDPESVGQTAYRGRVGPAVVIDHDHQRPVVAGRDVVERLPAHPAGHRPVADHGDHRPVRFAAQRVRLGQPVRVGQRRGGVRGLDDVVLALRTARVPGQAAARAQTVEAVAPAPGEDLVDVGLVPGVEHERVARRVEDTVQGDGEVDHAEGGAEMSAGGGDLPDEEVADVAAELLQLVRVETP